MRPSSHISITAGALLAALACACSPRSLVLVDPDPCADGGIASGTGGCVPLGLLDGLVGRWRFDEVAGSTVAQDWSTRGNHGMLAGDLNPSTAWVPGHAAGALNVLADGYVEVPRSDSIDSITDQVTVSGWAYLDATLPIVDYAAVASRQLGTGLDQHYHISIDSRTEAPFMFIMTETTGAIRGGPTPIARQTWVHIASTYDGAVARLYVDGKEVTSQPLTGRFRPDTTPVILGGNGNEAVVSERFPGRIDEIMLYRRALSAVEIVQLYNGVLTNP